VVSKTKGKGQHGGKDELIKEMHVRYKRDRIKGAEVAPERFPID
jgi:hypothetical protein